MPSHGVARRDEAIQRTALHSVHCHRTPQLVALAPRIPPQNMMMEFCGLKLKWTLSFAPMLGSVFRQCNFIQIIRGLERERDCKTGVMSWCGRVEAHLSVVSVNHRIDN